MNIKILILPIFVAFILATIFGLYLPMGHVGHGMPCGFAPGGVALCSTPFAHLEHWQSAFMSVLMNVGLLLVLVLVAVGSVGGTLPNIFARERVRLRHLVSRRPTRIQELFSRGILNRKEPYGAVV